MTGVSGRLATLQKQNPNRHARVVGKNSRRFARTQRRGKSEQLLEEMLLTSRARFVAIAYSILGTKEDAEDAVQNAFLSAYLYVGSFKGRSALTTWLTRIVINAALMIRRKQKASRLVPLADHESSEEITAWEQIATSTPDPEKAYAHKEILEGIDTELAKLRPALRQAFVMTYYDELSYEEACVRLGIPRGTFKARAFRARRDVVSGVKTRKAPAATRSCIENCSSLADQDETRSLDLARVAA